MEQFWPTRRHVRKGGVLPREKCVFFKKRRATEPPHPPKFHFSKNNVKKSSISKHPEASYILFYFPPLIITNALVDCLKTLKYPIISHFLLFLNYNPITPSIHSESIFIIIYITHIIYSHSVTNPKLVYPTQIHHLPIFRIV